MQVTKFSGHFKVNFADLDRKRAADLSTIRSLHERLHDQGFVQTQIKDNHFIGKCAPSQDKAILQVLRDYPDARYAYKKSNPLKRLIHFFTKEKRYR